MVAQHLLESKVVVESLVMFWKEFTIIEETYAKSLRELLGNPAASFRTSILHRFTGFFNSDSGFEEGKYVSERERGSGETKGEEERGGSREEKDKRVREGRTGNIFTVYADL